MPFVPGFNLQEAEPLLALLGAMGDGYAGVPPLPQPPSPPGWTPVFTSPSIGPFDNHWQLWTNEQGQFAVLIQGTVDETGSIIDDLLSVMIPANSEVGFTVDGNPLTWSYQLAAANNTNAGVHLGFTLAMFILAYDPSSGILLKLLENASPGSDVFIAGHSQGAAIATLLRSYLNYLDLLGIAKMGTYYNYKSYVFAQPKPGNDLYGIDYDVVASNSGMAFTVINSQDWVPQVPLTIELLDDINVPNPLSVELEGLSSLVLKAYEKEVTLLREGVGVVQVSKHLAKMGALADIFRDPWFQQKVLGQKIPGTPAVPDLSLPTLPPILPTLNFANCGSIYGLLGTPGENPSKASDFFWQHHAAMYYALLSGAPIPT